MSKTVQAKVEHFRPQERNLNRHTQRGMGELESSIQRDGWVGALTVAADGEVFDGSARIEVAAATGFEDAIVVETDGTKPVIVKRTDIPNAQDERAVRLGIAANRVAELNLDWDGAMLAELVSDGFDFGGLIDEREIERLTGKFVNEPPVEFASYDESIETAYKCPKCQYEWSGRPK